MDIYIYCHVITAMVSNGSLQSQHTDV